MHAPTISMASESEKEVYVPEGVKLEDKDKAKFQADVKKISKVCLLCIPHF